MATKKPRANLESVLAAGNTTDLLAALAGKEGLETERKKARLIVAMVAGALLGPDVGKSVLAHLGTLPDEPVPDGSLTIAVRILKAMGVRLGD